MERVDPLELPAVREEDLDWTGFVPLDTRHVPVVWVPVDTTCRLKHNKRNWYEVQAGQPTYKPIITRGYVQDNYVKSNKSKGKKTNINKKH